MAAESWHSHCEARRGRWDGERIGALLQLRSMFSRYCSFAVGGLTVQAASFRARRLFPQPLNLCGLFFSNNNSNSERASAQRPPCTEDSDSSTKQRENCTDLAVGTCSAKETGAGG